LGWASREFRQAKLLKREAIARNRRVGKNIFYSVRPETVSALQSILDAARRELPEAVNDNAAMGLALCKRKDKAAEYFNKLAGKFGRMYIPGRSWQALAHALLRLLPPMVIAI
jgi:ArsR family transcriptional regulator